MATLTFEGAELFEVAEVAHRTGSTILLVKTEGVFLCAESKAAKVPNTICYASGYNPSITDRGIVWNKAHAAFGDVDFAEKIDLGDAELRNLMETGAQLRIRMMNGSLQDIRSYKPKSEMEVRAEIEAKLRNAGYSKFSWSSRTYVTANKDGKQFEIRNSGTKWSIHPIGRQTE